MTRKKAKQRKKILISMFVCMFAISIIGIGSILFLGKTKGNENSDNFYKDVVTEESKVVEEHDSEKESETSGNTLDPDWNFYEDVSTLSKFEIEEYADFVISTIINGSWDELAREIVYPITIAGVKYENEEEYLAADKNNWSSENFMKDILNEDCDEMFYNWQGIMLGENGSIWISEVVNEEYGRGEMKIIAINIE